MRAILKNPLFLLIAVAFLLRLLVVLAHNEDIPTGNYPFELYPSGKLAASYLQYGAIDPPTEPPLYPLMLLGLWKIGAGPMVHYILQILLSTATVYFIYRITRIFSSDEQTALIAGSLGAVYPPLVIKPIFLQDETTLFLFLFSAAIYFFLENFSTRRYTIFFSVILFSLLSSIWLNGFFAAVFFTGATLFFALRTIHHSFLKKCSLCVVIVGISLAVLLPTYLLNFRVVRDGFLSRESERAERKHASAPVSFGARQSFFYPYKNIAFIGPPERDYPPTLATYLGSALKDAKKDSQNRFAVIIRRLWLFPDEMNYFTHVLPEHPSGSKAALTDFFKGSFSPQYLWIIAVKGLVVFFHLGMIGFGFFALFQFLREKGFFSKECVLVFFVVLNSLVIALYLFS